MLEKLKRCVKIILIALILAGIVLIYMTVSFHRTFILYLVKRDKQKLFNELSSIYLKAFELLVCYSVGFFICQFLWKNETFIENIALMAFWNGISFLLTISGLVQVWILYKGIELLQAIVKSSLFEGIDLYFSNPEWKLLWDQIQYYQECCGVNGYSDWKIVSWITDEENKYETQPEPRDYVLIPYVCCKRTAIFCLQAYKPHLDFAQPNINISEINTKGCLSKLTDISVRYYANIVTLIVCVVILHVFLLILQITSIYKVKKTYRISSSSEKQPLIIVKYPRNVRCVTCTNDSSENYAEDKILPECRSTGQSISEFHKLKADIFLH